MALDDWRQESRDLKQQKQYEAIRKGVTKGKNIFDKVHWLTRYSKTH